MKKRRLNHRLVKINRNYTVEEVADLFGIHKNTVRNWIKHGLVLCDDKRPILFLGRNLQAFLHTKRIKNKQKCKPGELYCMKCRAPKKPAGDMVEYKQINETIGNLIATCTDCGKIMNRRVNPSKLEQIREHLDIPLPQAQLHINDSSEPTVNSDLE